MPQFQVCLGLNSPLATCKSHLVCVLRSTTECLICIARLTGSVGQGWQWQVGDWEQSAADVALYDLEILPAFRATMPVLVHFITADFMEDGEDCLLAARDQAAAFFAAGGRRSAQTHPG